MRHLPSGTMVRVETERSQLLNRESAKRLLMARLAAEQENAATTATANNRRAQVGSGERGDKRRTIRMQDGHVVDHVTGKRTRTDRYLRGHVDDLH
jgi:peptide chain release factor 1